jgi:hypothetical protein
MLSSGRPRRGSAPSTILLLFFTLSILTMALSVAPSGHAQNRDLVVAAVEPANRVSMTGHHPAWASAQNDLGVLPADLLLGHLELVLARPPQLQQAFDQFLQEQLDPASANYHHWLTPVEIGERFGASQHDTDAITNWLQSQNLHLDAIANSRVRVQFSGPASAVANAFGAEMHYYLVDGEQRLSIAAEPRIPAALTGIIKSISGLYTINVRPLHGMETVQIPPSNMVWDSQGTVVPELTTTLGNHYITPSDFATIYDVNTGGINGAGQTIAIIGRSRVYAQDITNFQSLTGLPQQAPIEIVPPNGVDPGPPETSPPTSGTASKDQLEATLDVTRAASVAPGATIELVVSTVAGGGIETASQYVVDTIPVSAQIMNISFGACESNAGQPGVTFWDSLLSQAAMEGISVFISSGDSGAAGCDAHGMPPPSVQTLSINYICASSHATCVGGTEFADAGNPTQYWSASNSFTLESALGYIPEGGWNEPVNKTGQFVARASGGGVSNFIATPSWQTGPGVPGTQGRYTPDIAFSSSGHDGYFACFEAAAVGAGCARQPDNSFKFVFFFGTSAAAPDMAGITALLNQKYGAPQGELNSRLYSLASAPSNNVFHDVTVASSAVSGCSVTTPSMCNNSTPSPTGLTGGLSGYLVGPGYDEVTGLGSIDVANLLAHWVVAPTTTSVSSNMNPAVGGASVTFTATVTSTSSGTPTGIVTFLDNGASIGAGTLNSSAMAMLATSSLAVGSHSITAQYGGDPNFASSTANPIMQIINRKPSATLLTSSLNPSVGGQSVTFTATVTSTAGGTPTGTVTFSEGATSLGSGPLNAGGATFTTSSLTMGSHSITASYGGDTNFAASASSALSQAVNIAAFAPVSGTATVTAGQNVVINLTVYQSSGSNLAFTLSCAGLPLKSTCSFSPNPVTPGAPPTGTPVQLTFATQSSGLPANPTNRSPWPWGFLGISATLAALFTAGMIQLRRVPRHRLAFGMCICVIALASVLIGCGGGGYSSGPPYTGTLKGTATFTVTGVSGATTITTPVSVSVQ